MKEKKKEAAKKEMKHEEKKEMKHEKMGASCAAKKMKKK